MTPENQTPETGTRFLQDTHTEEGSTPAGSTHLPVADRVIVPGDDGEMIARPASEVIAESLAAADADGMELFITDEVKRDKDAWNSTVQVAGSKTVFRIREMDEDEKAALNHRNTQELADLLGIPVACIEDKNLFMEKLKEIPDGFLKWTNFQVETNLNICLEHVKDWIHDPKAKAKPPFSLDVIRRQMAPSARFKLAQAIVQKSTIGASQSDFLEPS